jgi:lysozyme family protein
MMEMDFKEWLAQPSTIKGIVGIIASGTLAVIAATSPVAIVVAIGMAVQSLVNLFYDQNPRKPPN